MVTVISNNSCSTNCAIPCSVISLTLGRCPVGNYSLVYLVTDQGTGGKSSATLAVHVEERESHSISFTLSTTHAGHAAAQQAATSLVADPGAPATMAQYLKFFGVPLQQLRSVSIDRVDVALLPMDASNDYPLTVLVTYSVAVSGDTQSSNVSSGGTSLRKLAGLGAEADYLPLQEIVRSSGSSLLVPAVTGQGGGVPEQDGREQLRWAVGMQLLQWSYTVSGARNHADRVVGEAIQFLSALQGEGITRSSLHANLLAHGDSNAERRRLLQTGTCGNASVRAIKASVVQAAVQASADHASTGACISSIAMREGGGLLLLLLLVFLFLFNCELKWVILVP